MQPPAPTPPKATAVPSQTHIEITPDLQKNIDKRGTALDTSGKEVLPLEPTQHPEALTREAHPEWAARKRSTAKLPQTTRTEPDLKGLGYDKRRPRKGYSTGAKPPGLYRALDYIWSLSQPELHHFWPKYLKGLPKQSLGKLSGMAHDELHASLIKWKGGIFNYNKVRPGPRPYELMSPEEVFRELREFYDKADKGMWNKYMPNFEKAAEETLRKMGKWPPK
jgi:hypothetical protein